MRSPTRTHRPRLLDPQLIQSPYLTSDMLTPEQLDQRTQLIQRAKARTHAQEPTVQPEAQLKAKQLDQAKRALEVVQQELQRLRDENAKLRAEAGNAYFRASQNPRHAHGCPCTGCRQARDTARQRELIRPPETVVVEDGWGQVVYSAADAMALAERREWAKQTFGTGWDTPSGTASV